MQQVQFSSSGLGLKDQRDTSFLSNGTSRAYILSSALITIILMLTVIAIGPSKFTIEKIHFQLCDPNDCSQNRTPYIFAFGLMCTWFLSAMIFLAFKSCRIGISRFIFPFQIFAQIIFTILAAYMEERAYQINYWMFFNSLKYYFLQAVLVIQTIQILYSTLIHHDYHLTILSTKIASIFLYGIFAATNAMWFFGERCGNDFDILFVCVVTVNIITVLASMFDPAYGLFLPLLIAAASQVYLSHTLHSTPRALECGKSPFADYNNPLQWINLALAIIAVIVPGIKIIHYFTSQRSIDELFFNDALRHDVNDPNSKFYQPYNHITPTSSNETTRDPLLLPISSQQQLKAPPNHHFADMGPSFQWSFTTQHEKQFVQGTSAPRHYQFIHNLAIEDVDNDVFVEHYFYNTTKRCAPIVTTYFFATFIFSILIFTLTHFGEHKHFTHLGINSNHIQWYYIMNIAWTYVLYLWYLFAVNCCPKRNIV